LNVTNEDGTEEPAPVSYSGYFTVNETYNSNLFFWFFPALNPEGSWEDAPVLLWLQGGPGASSLYALFSENGPIAVTEDLKLVRRQYTWVDKFNVIYFDNPVGTGYSFTDDVAGFATDEVQVGSDMYTALLQFFTLFPTLQDNPFYVTGESYGGKYIPAVAYAIHTQQNGEKEPINLVGIAIGNGLIDPYTMSDYGRVLYEIGLIDDQQRDDFTAQQNQAKQDIDNGDFLAAFRIFDLLINGDKYPYPTLFNNYTGNTHYFNYLLSRGPTNDEYYNDFLEVPGVRKAIHVGNIRYNDGSDVEQYLLEDIMNTVKPWVQALIDADYRVLLFSGQLDLIVPYTFTREFLKSLTWSSPDAYYNANRTIWKVQEDDVEVAGYVKNLGNFYEVLVRDAGHMVPLDQPRVGLDLIQRFILEQL